MLFRSRILCMHKILVHAQDSCAWTRTLCMHKILVYAQDSCACTRLFVHAQDSRACTRFLCMHKNLVHKILVHARDSCACIGFLSMLCMHKNLVRTQDSCACARFLCMHNTLVHAQNSCACTGGARAKGRDLKQKQPRVRPGRRLLFCWVPTLGPGPSSACTRVLCMHKSVVHAQEINININVGWLVGRLVGW